MVRDYLPFILYVFIVPDFSILSDSQWIAIESLPYGLYFNFDHMDKQTVFVSFIGIVFMLFFMALSLNGGETMNSQVYGRGILPYEYLSSAQITPTCMEKEQVIGRGIYRTCEVAETIAENNKNDGAGFPSPLSSRRAVAPSRE